MVQEISNVLYAKFGNRVNRRSGEDISSQVKRMKLAVEAANHQCCIGLGY
ncbi:MAG: hypothetical protein HEP80_06560 [Dolichospermum sp. UKL201]|nr:MAG: hypothetical protein HEP80_06560 [Dolichospermum sp. UKL201]